MASVKNCQFVESSPEKGASDTFQKNDAEKDFILQLGKVN